MFVVTGSYGFCFLIGNPLPDLRWWKDDSEILDDIDHRVYLLLSHGQMLSLSEIWYQLRIINVRVSTPSPIPPLLSSYEVIFNRQVYSAIKCCPSILGKSLWSVLLRG